MSDACLRSYIVWNTRRPHDTHFSCSFCTYALHSFYSRGSVCGLVLRLPARSSPTRTWAWCFDPALAGYVLFVPLALPWCLSGPPLPLMWWRRHIILLRGGSFLGCHCIPPIGWWAILLSPCWLVCLRCVQSCCDHFNSADFAWICALFQSLTDAPSCRSRMTCALYRAHQNRYSLSPKFFLLPFSPPTWWITFLWRCRRRISVVRIFVPSRSWVPSHPCLGI